MTGPYEPDDLDGMSRDELEFEATRAMDREFGDEAKYSAEDVRDRIGRMSDDDLKFTISADHNELIDAAKMDIDDNPWWYH